MIPQPKPIPYRYDGLVNFTLGVDSSKSADIIAEGYSSFAVNTTFRNGKPTNRPAFKELVIPDQEHKAIFQNKKHQGEFGYQNLLTNTGSCIAVRGGWILELDLDTLEITLLNPTDRNNTTRRHYFAQADTYLIIQNGEDFPFIWDGTNLRRAYCRENNPGVTNLSVEQIAGIGTVTTDGPHGYVAGDFVALDGDIDPVGYLGTYRVRDVPTPDTYRIAVTSTLTSPATLAGTTYRPMEVPIGTFMEYAMGRLCVVTPDRREMHIGDLIRTTPDTFTAESVLWFTEENFLAESYVFSLPSNLGRIRTVKSVPYMGAPTGQGDIIISGDSGLATLSLAYPRAEWFDKPIQKVALTGLAMASQDGIVGFNGDVIFRDLEYGIRTFRLAEVEFQKSPTQSPISSEMNRVFLADDTDKLQFSSMVVHHNRLLTTTTPTFEQRSIVIEAIAVAGDTATITMAEDAPHTVGTVVTFTGSTAADDMEFTITAINGDNSFDIDVAGKTISDQGQGGFVQSQETGSEYYHKGLAVLDYTTLSGAQGVTQPAWDGLWTGLNIQSVRKIHSADKSRTIIAVYNDKLHRNELWELTKESGPDVGEFSTQYAPASVEFSALEFSNGRQSGGGREAFSKKKLLGISLFLTGIKGNTDGSIFFRNDGDVCWYPWKLSDSDSQFSICAETSTLPGGETNPNFEGEIQSPAQRRNIRIGQPQFECESQTLADHRLFYYTQIKINWTGMMTIDRLQVTALEEIEDMRGGCR